ncbi:MAG: AAA family ATPase [Spirochaetales bacterium]
MRTLDKGHSKFLAILELPLVQRLLEGDWDAFQFEFALQYVSNFETTKGQQRYFRGSNLPGLEEFCEDSSNWWTSPRGGSASDRETVREFLGTQLQERFARVAAMDRAEADHFVAEFIDFFGLTIQQFTVYLAFVLAHLRMPWHQVSEHNEDRFEELALKAAGTDAAFYNLEFVSPRSRMHKVGLVSAGGMYSNPLTIADLTIHKFGLDAFDKGTINRMFDDLEGPVVFITNQVDRIDPSTARRFDLVIRFEEPSQDRLVALWHQEVERQGLSAAWNPQQIRALAQRFKSNLGVVSQACQLIRELPVEVQAEFRAETVLETVLGAQLRLVTNRKPEPFRKASELYDMECLNTSVPVTQLVDIARRWNQKSDRAGLKYLLHGITGGGKSALARHLADELGLPVLFKQASDLLGAFVGQNEQNIRQAFDEAERTGAVLVIDEVDSFLSGRAGGKRGWENSMVNEFLTNIENFQGFLVVSTNLMEVLDVALLRRFTLKVEFRALTPEASVRLLVRYFPELDPVTVGPLRSLTPGDFGAVKARQELCPELDVLAALQEEAAARAAQSGQRRSIGF